MLDSSSTAFSFFASTNTKYSFTINLNYLTAIANVNVWLGKSLIKNYEYSLQMFGNYALES